MDRNHDKENSDKDSNIESDNTPTEISKSPNDTDEAKGKTESSGKKEKKVFNYDRNINSDTVINGIQVVFTIAILFIAIWQNRYARQSAEAAIKATNIADSTYQLSVKSSNESDSINRVRFKMDSATYQAQINALNEQSDLMKQQFKITNRPFLVIDIRNLDLDNLIVSMTYSNYGRYPTKIIQFRSNLYITKDTDDKSLIKNFNMQISKAKYIDVAAGKYINSEPFKVDIPFNDSIDQNTKDSIFKGETIICYGSETIYEDIITKAQFKLTYVHKSYNYNQKGFKGKILTFDDIRFK